MENNAVSVHKMILEREMTCRGVPLLTCRIEYPALCSCRYGGCAGAVSRLCEQQARAFCRHCETGLFRMAVRQYCEDLENGYPVRKFEALQTYEITDLRDCVFSVLFDRYEYTGGAHGSTVRTSRTWNLQSCGQMELGELICGPRGCRPFVLDRVAAQIGKNPENYFDNYRELIGETFCGRSFYCTPKGIAVYFQQYDIAPYSTGIPEFLIPYGDGVTDPVRCCRT